MTDTLIENVSDTALWVATYRARETDRPDALFRDPLAKRLVGDKGPAIARTMKGSQYTDWAVVIRTCIIDAFVRELVAQGVDTVVNLGAGLDTRPYRLELPATLRWIEVDFPSIIELKNERLKGETPRCQLERIVLDLSDRTKRQELFAGIASRSSKVLVLTEGVLPYLASEDVAQLAQDLRAQPVFRFWIVDYFAPQLMRYMMRMRRGGSQMRNAPMRFCPEDWHGFFAQNGWKAYKTEYYVDTAQRVGRMIRRPLWGLIMQLFTPARKREAFRKYLAYVVLEPK